MNRPFQTLPTLRQPVTAPMRRIRFLLVASFFLVWATLISGRLFWLQVVRHGDYMERATRQQQRTFAVAPRRGVLYDRNLHELAMTVLADSVYAVPSEIVDKPKVAAELSTIAHAEAKDNFTSEHMILARLQASRNFAWVARKLSPEASAKIKALNLKGVYVQKEFKRYYPHNDIAAQVLGYVGIDDNGLGGLEMKFDQNLHGTSGRMLTAIDARRQVLGSEERDPQPGDSIKLTIDENIQFMAETALDHAMEKFKALNGTVVVQDPHTGQILALAIRPTFNPNDFRHATPSLLRNHAVSDVYEPGSTFKLVTYSAALDMGVTHPEEMIDCMGGKITIFGRTIHDSHLGTGVISVEKALWESSDVAAVKLAMRMGQDNFYKYIRSYGFGQRSNLEVPSETRGLLRAPARWGKTSIGSIAIGQEVGVTPIQLATMVSTIANGGTYLPPHILLNTVDGKDGKNALQQTPFRAAQELPTPLPQGSHRVISEMTAAKMRRMMEGIVLYGTGRSAALNGYSSAGKTGTAQKIDVRTHTYSKTKYVASFAGFAPVNSPVVSVAVIIDSPEGAHMGALVSGPVFKELTQQILEYMGIPHDTDLKTPATTGKDLKASIKTEDLPAEHTGDLGNLFAAVNDLPQDDPLRASNPQPANDPLLHEQSDATRPTHEKVFRPAPAEIEAAQDQSAAPPLPPAPTTPVPANGAVVDSGRTISVPSFTGLTVRQAIEKAGTLGLGVQVLGSGLAHDQAPAAGSHVSPGTQVVVRFSR